MGNLTLTSESVQYLHSLRRHCCIRVYHDDIQTADNRFAIIVGAIPGDDVHAGVHGLVFYQCLLQSMCQVVYFYGDLRSAFEFKGDCRLRVEYPSAKHSRLASDTSSRSKGY